VLSLNIVINVVLLLKNKSFNGVGNCVVKQDSVRIYFDSDLNHLLSGKFLFYEKENIYSFITS